MKKLIAILFSVLMLCTLIPFATVAAEDYPDVQLSIVDELEAVNAGDEFQVQVDLLGLEDTAGLISVLVEIGFDTNVFEAVTYFDEDEEMWLPSIEIGSKYNATSNKYISYGQIYDDGSMKNCLVKYMRALASETQVRREQYFCTITLKVKDDAPAGTYDLTAIQRDGLYYGNIKFEFDAINTSITVNGSEPTPPECEHEYEYDCSKVCSKCGEETRPEAEHQYFYACDAHCMICGELTNPEAAHAMNHVEAKPATCTENGNIEYWYCDACGGCWDNENATGMPLNRMMVIVPAAHTYDNDCDPDCNVCFENREELNHNVIHVEAVPATCTTEGNIEYWYCDVCGMAWLDEACTLNTNLLSVKLPASCSYNVEHVAAKEATCFEPGNIEYWYCANCDVYYADAACAIVTNAKNVIIPITHNIIHVEAKDATCFEPGNIEYWYCADCGSAWTDELCREVTNLKNVVLPIAHNVIHVEAKDATCTELGNIEYWYCDICGAAWLDELCIYNTNLMAVKLPMAEHTYDADNDADCNVCGAVREIAAEDIILFGGNSVTEIKGGLAFRFDAAIDGIVIGEDYVADYSNATVTIGGEEYKLVKMGAIMNNKGYADQSLDNVDGTYVLNIEAAKVFDFEEDGKPSYAVRIINIPAEHLDTIITARPYFVYENLSGEQITVYGADQTASYNSVLNG